ncbi:hypothetical protein JOC75_002884 [Metabacillus crassostreae]|nr:hypothetical protein [Metabacillus crassostreae]
MLFKKIKNWGLSPSSLKRHTKIRMFAFWGNYASIEREHLDSVLSCERSEDKAVEKV